MNSGLIAGRYAKALYMAALDKGDEDLIYTDMLQVEKILQAEPRVISLLSEPVLSKREKKEFISKLSGEFAPLTYRFFSLLVDNKRESKLHSVAMLYVEYYRKQKNISTVKIETAIPISDSLKERVAALIQKKTHGSVEVNNAVEPRLLGGYVLSMNGCQMDRSIAAELKRIKNSYSQQ